MTIQANASVANITVAGRTYPARYERRCRTCCHPMRARVETEVVAGRPWTAVANSLPDGPALNARNIADHFRNGHLPVKEETVARLAERQADERGQVLAAGADAVVAHADFVATVLARTDHLVRSGAVAPTVRDGLAAATLLAQLEAERPAFDEDDLARVILIHLQVAEDSLPADVCTDYLQRVAADPAMRAMAERWEQAYGQASA
jgi:hypothetical protein